MDIERISYCKIFPAIGVARVGDSMADDGFFFPPEIPGETVSGADGAPAGAAFHYRDSEGRVKRQAARFRVYAFDSSDMPLGELTVELADIVWRVELTNKKAAWFGFAGTHGALSAFAGEEPPRDIAGEVLSPRNPAIGKMEIESGSGPHGKSYRSSKLRAEMLEIHGGQRMVGGPNARHDPDNADPAHRQLLDFTGKFKKVTNVYLGELRTDDAGRLVVLGGRGKSDAVDDQGMSIRDARWIKHYANNNDWYDDTSDGPVHATVKLKAHSQKPVEVRGAAWVIVSPPDFAPDLQNMVTLYDVLEEVAVYTPALVNGSSIQPRDASKAEFERDIFSLLRRVDDYRWVNQLGLRGHGFGKSGDFFDPKDGGAKAQLNEDGVAGKALRERILSVIRKPCYEMPGRTAARPDSAQATEYFMPPLSGDEGTTSNGDPGTWLSVTYLQYDRLNQWVNGGLCNPTVLDVERLDDGSPEPLLLTRALMERCCGGAFYPGIEITAIARDPKLYVEAGRFNASVLEAGDITKFMAVPWQADFFECNSNWWPAQRPDEVIHETAFQEIFTAFPAEKTGTLRDTLERLAVNRVSWARGVGDSLPRPSDEFIADVLLPAPARGTPSLSKYVATRAADWARLLLYLAPNETNTSPWRRQYVMQEHFDQYSGRYYHLLAPDPDTIFGGRKLADSAPQITKRWVASDWRTLRSIWRDIQASGDSAVVDELESIGSEYHDNLITVLTQQLKTIFMSHPAYKAVTKTASVDPIGTFVDIISKEDVDNLDKQNRGEVHANSPQHAQYALAELRAAMADCAYLRHTEQNGDNAMVDAWRNLGFVVRRELIVAPDEKITVQVESERNKFDGLSFRDHFYLLLNIQEYPDLVPYSRKIAADALARAEELIDSPEITDTFHPESYVPYDPGLFNAKMEEVYEILRSVQQDYDLYDELRSINREGRISRILHNAPFNQLDGSWLRHVAVAGPSGGVNDLLFEVWSDEIGNGDPALHHANLYTALLQSLGIDLPDITTRAYASDTRLSEQDFVSPVFQLAISQNNDEFLPEIIGMTLFLEWEVLSLTPGIRLMDYLGMDSKFWRMHVGIDNATDGHGAKAKRAVEIYLDKLAREGGDQMVQAHWRRIWLGYVAFAAPFSGVFGSDDDVAARRPGSPADRLKEVIARKRKYGSLNHGRKRIGGHRLNDLFSNPDLFLETLGNSKWVVPGQPEASQLLTYLTTFDGPMYKVFDSRDLGVWHEWIEWLGREGDTAVGKRYIDKGEAMLLLLESLRSQAESVEAHTRYKVDVPETQESKSPFKRTVAEYFSIENLIDLMQALRAPNNGWVVPGLAEQSPLVADMARGGRPMGMALEKRFERADNRIGRQILIEWVRAGCPIPGQEIPSATLVAAPAKAELRQLLMHVYGMQAVH